MKRFIFYIFIVMFFGSCEKEHMGDCFKSSGKTVSVSRAIPAFTEIDLYDRIQLNYYHSSNYKVEVKGGENLIDGVVTKVKDKVLLIENKNRCNWVRSFKKTISVDVYAPKFTDFTYHGSGEVTFVDTLKTDRFLLNLWDASGNMHIKILADYVSLKTHTAPGVVVAAGNCRELVTFLGGNGRIDAFNLKSQKALVINKNTGDILVNCQREMKAEIKGSGDIKYIGSPAIDFTKYGSGNLIKKGD